jgi:sporulation protein YlmC with PRC-barrel domain
MTNPIPPAALMSLALCVPIWAAAPPATAAVATPSPVGGGAADACTAGLKAFDARMQNDGYWHAGEGYGFGYPMGEAGFGMYGAGANQDRPALPNPGYHSVRPGYEVRVLIDGATIMARHGQEQGCEDILAQARTLYATFFADMKNGGPAQPDGLGWRMREIQAAVPVTSKNIDFRSDELLGVEVRSPSNIPLGSVDDLVTNPKTGQIAYLVIARGGIFGFDETHVAVPWDDFKATPTASLLVLDTTQGILDGAPKADKGAFSVEGDVEAEGQKVNAYWKAHFGTKADE